MCLPDSSMFNKCVTSSDDKLRWGNKLGYLSFRTLLLLRTHNVTNHVLFICALFLFSYFCTQKQTKKNKNVDRGRMGGNSQ